MHHVQRSQKKNLLLAFDAFGTLFTPRKPIAVLYGETARRHGLAGFSDDDIKLSFYKAFKKESKEHPNFGKAVGMKAPAWWANVISQTFTPFLPNAASLPDQLVPDLLTRFSTKDGYSLYPDVLPFFEKLRSIKHTTSSQSRPKNSWPWSHTIVGIITNSDDRIPGILQSFGLTVGPRRVGTPDERSAEARIEDDISFVVLSYDVGAEKPDQKIFDAAKQMLGEMLAGNSSEESAQRADEFEMLFVGDDLKKDVLGAKETGWHSVLIDREGRYEDRFSNGEHLVTIDASSKDEDGVSSGGAVQVIRDLRALEEWRPSDRSGAS